MNKAAQALGKLGGKKTLAKYGSSHFSKIRKGKKKGVDKKLDKRS